MNVQRSLETGSLYERDFHAWLDTQARLIRSGTPEALDLPNLLEEVEAMDAAQISELESRIAVILEHLLKFHYGRNRQPAIGWRRTLLVQRHDLARLLKKNPSLKRLFAEAIGEEYASARKQALLSFEEYEPHLLDDYAAIIPADCLYSVAQVLDEDWHPDTAV